MNAPAIESLPGYVGRLDARKLQPGVRHYNPSVCAVPGPLLGARTPQVLLCAYRVQDAEGQSSIGLCFLTSSLSISRDRRINIEAPKSAHLEDPRLVLIDGRILLFVVQIDYAVTDWKRGFLLRCFELDPATLQPGAEIPLPYGHNGRDVCEKNWIPCQLPGGGLGLVYSLNPFRVIDDSGMMHETPGLARWRWGTVSGRTPALSLGDGRMLCLIGGHQEHPRRKSLYWVGACVFCAEAHEILGVSREPLFWASAHTAAILNPFDPDWNPLCVFPAGLVIEDKRTLLVSMGTNDSFCDFLRLDLAQVLAGLVKPEKITGDERLIAPREAAPIGPQVRVRVISAQPVCEPGGPYVKGDEFFIDQSRAVALGADVEVIP